MVAEEDEDGLIVPTKAELPADWQNRADYCGTAVGFEGGSVEEVDYDSRFFLVVNQGLLVELMDEEDALGIPSVFAQEFTSADDRELHLQQKYGDLLLSWRIRQGRFYDEEPRIGRLYPVVLLNGYSSVTDTERDEEGHWTRVEVECTAGCMPMPPDGDFDSDSETWELPTQRFWLTREEWNEALVHSHREF